MLILLAEDDQKLAKLLIHLLNKDGYQVDHAKDGAEALLYAGMNQYDVLILDWMMPQKSGVEVTEALRANAFAGGILLLTAKDTLENKVEGLEVGADDYLTKPFEYRELLARLKALGRRSNKKIVDEVFQIGHFRMERSIKRILYNEVDLELSNREFQVFSLLLENNRQTIPRELILDKVWGIDQEVSKNNLEAFIKLLRKKIERAAGENVILNVRGVGYKVEIKDV